MEKVNENIFANLTNDVTLGGGYVIRKGVYPVYRLGKRDVEVYFHADRDIPVYARLYIKKHGVEIFKEEGDM